MFTPLTSAFAGLCLLTGGLFVVVTTYLMLHWQRRLRATRTRTRYPYQPMPAKWAMVSTDLLVMWSSMLLTYGVFHDDGPPENGAVMVYVAMSGAAVMWCWITLEHYSRRRPFWNELKEVMMVSASASFMTCTLFWVLSLIPRRSVAVEMLLGNLFFLPMGRAVCRESLNHFGLWQIPTVIVGAGQNAREAIAALEDETAMGYKVIGLITLEPADGAKPSHQTLDVSSYSGPELHNQIEVAIDYLRAHQVVIALDSLATPVNQGVLQHLVSRVRGTHVIPSIRGLPLFGTTMSHFFSHEVLLLSVRNNLSRRSYKWVKRGFDIAVSGALLLLLSPVFLVLSLLVRKSGASAFYGHPRVGQNGTIFKCLKFRSMRPDADQLLKQLLANDAAARAEWAKDFKLKNDPRITPVGHFLRKTSLDELPQLFNVLQGSMSLVGPRPVVSEELARYEVRAELYLQVVPGITGLWQISGRNDISYAERVALDVWYVKNWSLWYDIAILFKTLSVVFKRSGAY